MNRPIQWLEPFRSGPEMAPVNPLYSGIHEGNFARYRVRPSEFEAWRKIWS